MSVRKKQREEKEVILWTYEDMGRMHTSHPPFAEQLCGTGKGIEELTLGPPKGSSGQGQPSETDNSDVIGKRSNQGSRRVSTVDHSPQESHLLPAVVLGS